MKRVMEWCLCGVALLACSASQRVEQRASAPVAQQPAATAQDAGVPAARPIPEARLVLLPDAQSPVVAVRLVFLGGLVEDPAGQEGVTALTASLMAEATEALDASALRAALFPFATDVEVQTDRETTVFSMSVHREVAAQALPLLFDVLTAPRLDPKDLARLQHDASEDLQKRLRQADDEGLGHAALTHVLWKDHPYAHVAEGTVRSLAAITLEHVKAQRARLFTQARVLAGMAGGFDAPLEALFRAGVTRLPRGEAWDPVALPQQQEVKGRRVTIVQKDTGSTPINLGFRYGVSRRDADFVPLLVANSAFGEHRQMGGRLFRRMRDLRGLNYGDYSYVEHFVQEGWDTLAALNIPSRQQAFTLWVRPVEAADRVFALRMALRELEMFVDGGITQDEFERTRGFLLGYTLLWEQGQDRRLGWALDDVLNSTPDFLGTLRQRLKTLTLEEVNAVVKKHVQAQNLHVVMLAPDAPALKEALLGGRATPRAAEKTAMLPPEEREEDARISGYDLRLDEQAVQIVHVETLF